MSLINFPKYHSYLNNKAGMSGTIGPNKQILPKDTQTFIGGINAATTIYNTLTTSGLNVGTLSDEGILGCAPVVVDGEFTFPENFYETVLQQDPPGLGKGYHQPLIDIINLVSMTKSYPIKRNRFHFMREIGEQFYAEFPKLPPLMRILSLTDTVYVTLFCNRFLFIISGDIDVTRDIKGHVDLFGFDLHGLIEEYINGRDLCKTNFKMPTALKFKNVPISGRPLGGAFIVDSLEQPTNHTWVEILGRNTVVQKAVTVDFKSIRSNYETKPTTVLDNIRWRKILQMTKMFGEAA